MPSTSFDEDEVQRWGVADDGWLEERPYRECPNCGRHKFRAKQKRIYFFGVPFTTSRRIERCKSCKYEGDAWEEKIE